MIVDQPLAPLAVLAFLGAALFTVAVTASVLVARFSGKNSVAVLLLKVLGGGLGIYFVVMLGVSAFSKDYVLRSGAEKHYCEMDCHLAYSVTKVELVTTPPLDFKSPFTPQGTSLVTPMGTGQLYVVTLRTRFDETTIGPNRGNGLLYPNPRQVIIRDDAGKEYAPNVAFAGTPMEQPLRPGESYETRILFRLPADAKSPRLFLRNSPWPNAFLIGHENSPLHGKAYFDLKG